MDLPKVSTSPDHRSDKLATSRYHEAWIGEHHSGAYEIIASPEVFIAAAVERTTNLRFGTGVSSLSYHHPLMLADRMVQLDLQSLGRVMLGVGPGQLPTDAFMMASYNSATPGPIAGRARCRHRCSCAPARSR